MANSQLVKSVLAEVNQCRSNPRGYASKVEKQLQYFRGMVLARPGKEAIETEEGTAAVRECINKLNSTGALPTLQWVEELGLAAQVHVKDIGPKGKTGHIGSNGLGPGERIEKYGDWDVTVGENIDYGNSVAEDIVFSWLCDDGVPQREHRGNILEPAFKVAGIAHGPHAEYGATCCLVLAGGFKSKGSSKGATPATATRNAPVKKENPRKSGKNQKPVNYEGVNMTQEEINDCKEAFDLFDSDGSGTIDPREIEAALRSLGNQNSTVFRLLAGIEQLGADIDFENFLYHIDERLGDRKSREGIERILDLYDDDGTGTITLQNMVRVARELGETMPEDELLAALKKVSTNGDDISIDDFYKLMTRKINV